MSKATGGEHRRLHPLGRRVERGGDIEIGWRDACRERTFVEPTGQTLGVQAVGPEAGQHRRRGHERL